MKLLITGATGLVGKEITKQSLANGHSVNYLTTSRDKIQTKPNYQGYFWDPNTNEIDDACFNNVDAIIHLAGASIFQRWTDENKEIILKSRTETAALIFARLREIDHNVTQFVSASAIGAYPSNPEKLYTENYPEYHPGFLGKVVSAWEASADQFKELGLTVAKIRVGVVMAETEGALPQITKPIKMFVGAPLAGGEQWQSWVHVEDLAGIFLFAVAKKLNGVYNGVAPNPVTNKEMTKEAAAILNKLLWLPSVPEFVLKLMLGKMSSLVTESQKVSAEKIIDAGYTFKFPQLHGAFADLLK